MQEPEEFQESLISIRTHDHTRGNHLQRESCLQEQQRNFRTEKHEKSRNRRENRLVRMPADEFFGGSHQGLEDADDGRRNFYVDSRFNIYYVPAGSEFVDGELFRTRSDDTLSLGSAHRSRLGEEDDDVEGETSVPKKNRDQNERRGRKGKKQALTDPRQSVKHAVQIETPPRSQNELIRIEELKECRPSLEEEEEEDDDDDETLSRRRFLYSGSCASTPDDDLDATLQTASCVLNDPYDPSNNKLVSFSKEDLNFPETSTVMSTCPKPPSVSSSRKYNSCKRKPLCNAMKVTQPLSVYMSYTYDDLDPTRNITSV